jgi:proteasome accessory factor C
VSGATDRLPRLLALVPYLRTHPDELIADVAAVFDVTEKQLREDLELLFVTGLPGGSPGDLIDLSFEGDRVSLIDPQTLDRPLRLTGDEATALLVAARALADVPGLQERDALDRAIAKLAEAAPAPAAVDVALEPEDEALATLRAALDGHRRLHLRYMVEARDEVTERDVDPMRLLSREGRWYLEGWCRRAEAVRLFRLDRVVEATLLDLPAEPPPQAAPRDLEDGLFRPGPDDLRIVLELAPQARWVADHYPAEDITELADGWLRMTLRTPDPGWLVRLLLQLGPSARVLEPSSLAERLLATAREALATYLD